MKKTICVCICLALMLFACTKEKPISVDTSNKETQVDITAESAVEPESLQLPQTEIKKEIKNLADRAYYPIEESRDIFTGLFDDIKDVNYDDWGDGFTVRHEKSTNPFELAEKYIVENDIITIEFYNSEEIRLTRKAKERMSAQGRRLTGFIALDVGIKKIRTYIG